jgi:hypothetical protein
MVTNALNKLLGNYGWFANNELGEAIAGSVDDAPIKRLTGGIMLFDREIEESKDVIKPQAGASVVGCGSLISYNGMNTMAGSYNQAESGWTEEGGYKHVWDFSTSQSNGNIACASLTTNAGGKITEGTYPYSSDYSLKSGINIDYETEFYNYSTEIEIGNLFYGNWLLFADGINNRIITYHNQLEINSYTGNSDENFKESVFYKKSINLALYRFGFSNFSIFDSSLKSTKMDLLDVVTVDMPEGLSSIFTQEMLNNSSYYWKVASVSDENNIYIILSAKTNSSTNIQKGETIYIWEINSTSFNSTYYAFTNNLSEDIYVSRDGFYYNTLFRYFSICDDFVLACGTSTRKCYLINKNNSNDFYEVLHPDGSNFMVGNFSSDYNRFYSYGDKLIYIGSYREGCIDPVTKQMMYKNKDVAYDTYLRKKVKGLHWCILFNHDVKRIKYYNDPTLLVTINNLEVPVQKTSAQTMKVTYVLTQE